MSWHPADLVTDADLVAYEPRVLTAFAAVAWPEQRAKALEDWLWPQLRAQQFDPQRFRTRFVAAAVLGYTSGAWTDRTHAASDATPGDLPLGTILAASTDALYVGSTAQFRGLSVRMLDAVSAVATSLRVDLWCDTWQRVGVTDSTQVVSGTPFSGGGALTWRVPSEWALRAVNGSVPLYWARVACAAAPTSAVAAQVTCIRRSALCAPATFRTLAQIYRAAPIAQDGPWLEKAQYYEDEAERALQRALSLLGGEFDTVTVDDVIDATEAAQTADEARGTSGWTLERA